MEIRNKLIATILLILCGIAANAQDITATTGGNWLYWGLASLLVFLLLFLTTVFVRLKGLDGKGAEKKISLGQWWSTLDRKLFTNAVAVEKEEDILLDHDYDGIKELDNALPPWWKYGFYLTVIVAVFYFLRFHLWNTGPSPEQEYEREMTTAAAQIEEYRKKSNDKVDETTVTMSDAAGIAEGKKLFTASCVACHGASGEGGIGPNLTDKYWLHGGSINSVFKTIKLGVPAKGMQAWENTFTPTQMQYLASYVKSIVGSNPANGKAPQGELFNESAIDSTTATKDSTITAINK